MNRRSLILGATALFAAPAIVPVESLMKLWVPRKPTVAEYLAAIQEANLKAYMDSMIFGFGAVEYPDDGSLPRALSPADFRMPMGNNVDIIQPIEYDVGEFRGLSPLLDLKLEQTA